jgi:hypothetical protein
MHEQKSRQHRYVQELLSLRVGESLASREQHQGRSAAVDVSSSDQRDPRWKVLEVALVLASGSSA